MHSRAAPDLCGPQPLSTYSLVFDDGNLLGLGVNNCPGGLYSVVAPGTARFQTAFALH
jgi:hypothetical protein